MNMHLALFFIPAGVGIMDYFDLFGKFGWAILITLFISTAVTLGVTAWVFNILLRTGKKGESL
jgi:holin-like protein